MRKQQFEFVTLEKIINGGQCLGTLSSGKKCLVWGGLPGETVRVRITKRKTSFAEGVAEEILKRAPERINAREPDSFLSTSPWQIMDFATEQQYKASLIQEAFKQHCLNIPIPEIFTDNQQFEYRNKVEFSWYSETIESENTSDANHETLDLAFYRRGSKGKIVVDGTALAHPKINQLAQSIRDLLRTKPISARSLKTLLIRCDQKGNCAWQLYLKEKLPNLITQTEAAQLEAKGGELIYSDPKSPASKISKRLATFGDTILTDYILNTPFNYTCESFFQVNIPVYEQALEDMKHWIAIPQTSNMQTVGPNIPVLDLYSGVGTIGLTIGGTDVTLVEINQYAVHEMTRNISSQGRQKTARAILAASEKALDYISSDKIIIVDPPRAGLHHDVIASLLQKLPPRIAYLSCNPVTQARDASLLSEKYKIIHSRGYNFFPRTPHIEHLLIMDRKDKA